MGNFYISCAKDGWEYAFHTMKVLEEMEFIVYSDQHRDPFEESWKNQTKAKIENSSKFILILTKDAFDDNYVQFEYMKAAVLRDQKKLTIHPFKLENMPDYLIPNYVREKYTSFENKENLARKVVLRTGTLEEPTKAEITPQIPTTVKPRRKRASLGEPVESGIIRIFENRRCVDQQAFDDLSKQLQESITRTAGKVKMCGISLRDFFGESDDEWKVMYRDIIDAAIKEDIQFEVLLLDPTSEAAKQRAILEEGSDYSNDEKYRESNLFKHIDRVTEWLHGKPLFEVRCSTLTPMAFMIWTNECTFIEQYHMGQLTEIASIIREEDKNSLCLGGYVPLLVVDSKSNFGKLMRNHFESMFKAMVNNKLEKVLKKIERFKNNPGNFRREQFVESVYEKAEELLGSGE